MKPTNSLNQPIAQNRAATPKLAANCFSLLRLALPILAVLMLLGSQAKAGIFVHDGSTAVTYNGNVGAINQSVTVTAGADVLVVTVFNANTSSAVVEPSTLNWNGTTLNLAVSSDGLLQSLWRGVAIYYLYNPPVGTATITNIITTGGAPGIWVSAYTLSGVNKTSPPLIGSVANNSNPNTTVNFTVLGVVSNSWAAVGMSQSGTGDSVNITTIGGSTSASTDNSDNSSTMTAGLVSGLSAGVDTFIATANGTGQRDCFVGAVFAPASQVGGQKDLWTGFSSSTWDTTSINWTNSFPTNIYANGDAVVFDNSASQFNINLPASVVPTTVTFSNTAAQSYTINGSGQIGGGAVTIGTGSVTLNNPNNFGGPVTIGNAGSLTLNNVNTYGGSTTIGTGGSLLVGNSGLLGNGNYGGNIVNNGSLTFANSSLQILSGVISGSGTFTNNASGEIILRGASSFTNNIVLNAGYLSDTNSQNNQAPTVGGLGNPQTVGRTVTINSGATLSLDANGGNDFGGGSTIVNLGMIINAGGMVQMTAGNATVGPITLNGGELYGAASAGYSQQYGTYEFGGDITVGANTGTSTMLADGAYAFNLTVNAGSGALRTFNVGANSTLNVAAQLWNASNTQNPSTLVKAGLGTLVLNAANTSGNINIYSGGTIVSNGTLTVLTGGVGSGPVTVNGGSLGGSGTISNTITVNSGGHTFPGGASVLTDNTGLTYNSGGEADFTLTTTYNSGANDQIVLNGSAGSTTTPLLGGGAVVGIKTGTAALDMSGNDYVLINNQTGTNTPGIFAATPIWLASTPANAANFSVLTTTNQVVLHYSPVAITSVVFSPNPVGHNTNVTMTVTVTSTASTIQSVSANVSAATNGVSPLSLVSSNSTSSYTNSFVIAQFAPAGNVPIFITALDNAGNSNTISASIVVTPGAGSIEVWNGAAATNTWANGTNWTSGFAPAAGATVTFAGNVNTTANMESSYSISALTFSNNAASFNITNAANTLTLTGSITNNSTNTEILSVPVVLSSGGVDTFYSSTTNNLVFNQAVSGSDTVVISGTGTNIFAGNNSYTGPTTNNGNLQLSNPNGIKSSSKVTLMAGSKVLLRSDTSASFAPPALAFQNVGGTWNFDLNTNVANVTTPTTLTLFTNQLGFLAASDWTINVTGNSNYTLALGDITNNVLAGNHNPYLNNNIVTSPTGPAVQINSLLAGFWGNYFNARGGGRITIVSNITSQGASAGAYRVFVKDNTTLTLQGQSSISGDAFTYGVESGTLVLDNNSALVNRTTGAGQLQGFFILGAATNVYYGTQPFSPLAGLLLQANNSSNAAVYLGDANNATGGLSLANTVTNNVSDGDVGFANSGVFTIGGQNTSGVNTYNNPIILGLTPNKGKSVTLVATAGGEVDFKGGILANGTDITAGVTIGDATHTGIVAFNGSTPNTYAGGTKITNSILRVDDNSSGSSTGTNTVTVLNGGRLAGSGIVSGSVIVNSGGATFPGATNGNTAIVNLTINGNLTYNTGGAANFNLGPNGGNNSTITLSPSSILSGSNTAVNIYTTDSGHHLDTGSDYPLIVNLSRNFTGVFTNTPTWLGTPPLNSANYSIVTYSNYVALHYNPGGMTVSGFITANPSSRGQTVTIHVNATVPLGLSSIYVDASSINPSASMLTLTPQGGGAYAANVTIAPSVGGGINTLLVYVTDNSANQDIVPLLLTTTPGAEIWAGNGGDNNWSTGPNWAAGLVPVAGDSVTFAGTTRTTPNMESAYTLGALVFSNNASSFNLQSLSSQTLTMIGGVTNNSPNVQALSMPIALASSSGLQTFNAASNTVVYSNSITDNGLTKGIISIGTTNVLVANNSYSGPTIINSGVLVLSGSSSSSFITNSATLQLNGSSLISGSSLMLNSGSTLRMRSDTSSDFTPGGGIVFPGTSFTVGFDVNNLTAGVTGKTLSINNLGAPITFQTNINETINVTGNSTFNLGLTDIALNSASHTPYFALSISTVAASAGVYINSITTGFWGNYVNFTGGGNATVVGNLSNTSNGSMDLVVNGGTTVTLLGATVKANTGDAYKTIVENGTLVLDNNAAINTYQSGSGLNQCIFVLGATTNSTYFQSAGNFTPPPGVLFGTNNSFSASLFLGDISNATGGLAFPAGIPFYASDGDLGFTNGGVFTIGGQNTSGVNTYSNSIFLGMTAGGGKNVTLVAAPGGEVDFAGNILANAPNTTAGVNIGDATHSGVVHLNGNNTYGGLTTVTNATLGGRGTIAGSVLVVNGGHTLPGGGLTNKIAGNLTYTTGGRADFNLDSSATTGTNDQIILTGATSSVNGNGVSVGINPLSGTLDTSVDYVLITNLTGAGNSGIFASAPVWLGTPPINSANYSVITKGNQVVLHYSTAQIASGLASPNPAGRGVLVTFTVNASSPGNSITSVILDASSISSLGGSSSLALNSAGGSTYTNGVVISSTTAGGSYLLPVTVHDSVGGVNSSSIQLTVTSVSEVWSGLGSDTLWSTGPNWVSGFAPVSGDSLTFAGTTQLTPNMQANYFIPWLVFSNNAGSFNITNDGTHTLTLNGSVTNSSTSSQTLSVPVSLGAALTLNAAAGNITLSNTITGSGGITAIGATNTLAGNTSYNGPTIVNSGVLALSGNDVLFGGATVGSGSTMVMSGNEAVTALTINNTGTLLLSGAGLLNNGNDYANTVDNGTLNYSSTNSQNLLGVISGSGGLTLNSGTLTLGAGNVSGAPAGETYTGPTVINGGTLNLNFNNPAVGALNTSSGITINGGKIVSLLSSALEGYNSPSASSAPLTINAGGLLDVSPQFTVNGSGFSAHIQGILYLNGGTISNNAAYMQQYGGWGLYNACFVNGGTNTSIIADSEFCPVSVNLGTNTVGGTIFYITAGANQTIPGIDLEVSGALTYTHGTIDSGVIVGGNGTMRLDGLNTFSKFLTVSNNATLILGSNGQLNTVGPTNSFGSQSGNPNVQNGQLGGTVYSGLYSSPVTIFGTFIDTSTNVTPGIQTLSGLLAGTGLLEVTGPKVQLVLASTNNPFAGSIVVTNGALLKVAENTALVTGTTNSATGVGSVNVYASSTLGGSGIIGGSATNNSGGTLNPGLGGAAGTTLTISNLTMLAGSTNTFAVTHGSINDKVVAQAVAYGGTLNVTCANAAALAANDTFQLFSASTSYGLSSFANIVLPTLSAGLTWNTSNLGVNGTISVATVVSSPPTLGNVRLSSGSLIMSGTNGTPFAQYRILASTNVALPMASWIPVWTNTFASDGSYSYTNAPLTNAASYFRLVTP